MSGFVDLDSPIGEPTFRRWWRDTDGRIHASVGLGDSSLYFDDSATARAVAVACIAAADAMDAAAAAPE